MTDIQAAVPVEASNAHAATLAVRLAEPRPILVPGCFDAFTALLVERAGFEAAFVSGAGIAYTRLGSAFVMFSFYGGGLGGNPEGDGLNHGKVLAPVAGGRADDARTGTRRVHVAGAPREAAVYDRLALPAGAAVAGPAILEQADATTFLGPDLAATVDRFGNLVIARREG